MEDFVSLFQSQITAQTNRLREELKGIRTGRAHTGMIEGITIETYGGSMKMRLQELASITTDGTDGLVVMAFDPSTVSDIEKGILASPLGITPKTEGSRIVIRIPPLSEEQRLKFVKLVSQMIEETKNAIRRDREAVRRDIKRTFDEKKMTEDDKYRLEKDIDTHITTSNTELAFIKEKKEQEIMAV